MARISLSLLLLSVVLPVIGGDSVTSALGETAKLSPLVNCGEGETPQLIRRLRDDTPVLMADSADGVLRPVEESGSRLSISSSGIFLENVNYNDNGLYEFMCGDQVERIIQLKVVFASDVPASEGETVKLPCFFYTLGDHVEFVQWETNGQLVIKADRFGKVHFGDRFTDRASLPPDWESVGSVTLILKGLQLEDQGVYYCSVQTQDSKKKGDPGEPAACRLRVQQQRRSSKSSTTPTQQTQKAPAREETVCIGVTVFTSTVLILVVFPPLCIWIGWYLRSHKSKEVKRCLGLKCCWDTDQEVCAPDQEVSSGLFT